MAAEEPGNGDPAGEENPEEGGGSADRRAEDADSGGEGGSGRRSIPALLLALVAWIVGPILVAVGAFGMFNSTGTAGVYVLAGLLVTPRTRRELGELCRILCGVS